MASSQFSSRNFSPSKSSISSSSSASSSNSSAFSSFRDYIKEHPIQTFCASAGALLSSAFLYWYLQYRKEQVKGRTKRSRNSIKSTAEETEPVSSSRALERNLEQIPTDFIEQLAQAINTLLNTQTLDEEFSKSSLEHIHILEELAAALNVFDQQGEKETSPSTPTTPTSATSQPATPTLSPTEAVITLSPDVAARCRSYITPQLCNTILEWVVIFCTVHFSNEIRAASMVGAAAMHEAESRMQDEMKSAWHLVRYYETHFSISNGNDDPEKTAYIRSLSIPVRTDETMELLGLEIAQRIYRSDYVQKIYDSVEARFNNTPESQVDAEESRREEQLLALFMNAPQLGKWKEARRYGRKLVESKGEMVLEQFHHAALEEGFLPDYKILYDRAESFGQKWDRAPVRERQYRYDHYDITSVVLSHADSRSPFAELLEMNNAQFAGQPPISAEFPPGVNEFVRTGAIARMVSPLPGAPLPLTGICLKTSFLMMGYADAHSEDGQPGAQLEIQVEATLESDINNGAEKTYVGKLYIRDFFLTNEGVRGELKLENEFSLELTMRRSRR